MKTVVRNNQEETTINDTWYVLVSEKEVKNEEIRSPLFSSEDEAIDVAKDAYDETMYVAEVKLITKVVG